MSELRLDYVGREFRVESVLVLKVFWWATGHE